MHATLLAQLNHYPVPTRYVLALSGGCDSVSLLHALVQIKDQLNCRNIAAVHVHHGLQASADDWQQHCQELCEQLAVPLTTLQLALSVPKGESLEAYARTKRYQAINEILQQDDMLLLAHHQNDQVETLLLQLLRGSGVRGLASMPFLSRQAEVWQARPLLSMTRNDILDYAQHEGLSWVDDPSNEDMRFDRNFLRQQILPALQSRWPGVLTTLSRSASHQAEAAGLLNELAMIDWTACQTDERHHISISNLTALGLPRIRNVLRYWIGGICQLPMPDTIHLQRVIDEVMYAAADAEPMVEWLGVRIRRYRDKLMIEPQLVASLSGWRVSWDMQQPLTLPSGQIMHSRAVQGTGIKADGSESLVQVRFRQGGERCRLPGRQHHHDLKKLFQSWGVPPWQRDRIPLVYIGDVLAQVVGYSVCEPFVAQPGQNGVDIYLQNQLPTGH